MKSLRRALLKVMIFVPLAIIASILAIGGAGIVSLSSATRIGVLSLHSFWPCIPAAVCLQLVRKRSTLSLVAVCSAFLFLVIINIGSAISYITGIANIDTGMPISVQAMDILDTTLTGLILAIAFFPRMDDKECNTHYIIAQMFLLVAIPLSVYSGSWLFLFSVADSTMVLFAGLLVAIVGIAIFAILSIASLFRRTGFIPLDKGLFASATLLSAFSLVLFTLSITSGSDIWIYAENLQVAALLLYGLSLAIPYLRGAGFSRALSYLLIVGFSVFTYLPLMITISIEAELLVVEVGPSNFIAFGIIHLGAIFLSGMIAVLLYNYSRRNPTKSLYPLSLLYALWTFVAISSIVVEALRLFATSGEPIVSHLVASILTLLILVYTWLRMQSIPSRWERPSPKQMFSDALVLGLLVLTGEVINFLVMSGIPELADSPIGNSLLFGVNLLALLFLLSIFFALSDNAKGRATIEISMLLYLSVWIVPNILKSYYVNWSAGWWISQLMVFIGLLVGPALLGLLYIRALRETEESHMRAKLYADLLMHDVSNYHQMLLTSLELIGDDISSGERRRQLSSEARTVVSLADQLIANVRLMGQTEEITPAKLKPLNLVSVIVEALDEVMEGIGDKAIEFQYLPDMDHAPIMGDELLKHAFINIFLLGLQQPVEKSRITIEISEEVDGDKSWWKTTVAVPGECAEYEEMVKQPGIGNDAYSGTKLGMLVVRLIISSLGGSIVLNPARDIIASTEFNVLLPSLE